MITATTLGPRRVHDLDVADATGVSYRQLDYWVRCGVIKPVVSAAGSGSQRGFDDTETLVIDRLAGLAALNRSARGGGLACEFLAQVAEALRSQPGADWVDIPIGDGDRCFLRLAGIKGAS